MLWAPKSRNVLTGLNNSLAYQVYLGVYPPDQLFWIASENSDSSQAVGLQVRNSRVQGHGIRIVLYALVGLLTVVVLLK
jgi:hypothetical protein